MLSSSLRASPALLAVWLDKHTISIVLANALFLRNQRLSSGIGGWWVDLRDKLSDLVGVYTTKHKDLLDLAQAQCLKRPSE